MWPQDALEGEMLCVEKINRLHCTYGCPEGGVQVAERATGLEAQVATSAWH